MNRVFISLGSNIDKEKNLPAAIQLLAERSRLVAVSSIYETAPVGSQDQPLFWNAAALVKTELDAAAFRQQVLVQIEQQLKRVRTADPNAPRTIDADLILFNTDIFELDDTHHIPDPDFLKYPHVAVPIAELDPELRHPETGEPLQEIAQRLMRQAARGGAATLWRREDVRLGAVGSKEG